MLTAWNSAFAYIDPGSGSFLIQLIVGGLLAVSFALKTWRIRLISWVKKLFKGKNSEDETRPGPDAEN